MRIRTLGPLAAELDGGPAPPELLWRKHLALVVYLAKSPRRTRSRDHLIGLLWGDRPEPSARHSLNEAVRLVRRHLGDSAIATRGSQLTLAEDSVQLDENGPGAFLEGFAIAGCEAFEEWLASERGTHLRTGVDQLSAQADERLAAGDVMQAKRLAEQALTLAPTSEPATRALMRALALDGHGSLALEVAERLAHRLRDELGAELDAETRALQHRIRSGNSARRRVTREAGVQAGRRLPLVGREAEMTTVGDAIRAALDARRSAVCIVEGDSGSGKTRLMGELADRARLEGITVALSRAMPSEASEQWSALAGLVRGGLMRAPGVVGARPDAFAAVAQVDPESAPVGTRWVELAPARALPEVLRAICDEGPLLLAVDDAQWADPESLGAVATAARDLAAAPLVVLIGLRLQPESALVDELRARIGGDLSGVCVRLGPLDSLAIGSLAEAVLPQFSADDRERLVRRVETDSAGSPLLATEMIRAVAHGLDLGRAARAWPEPGRTLDDTIPADLPDAIVAAIRVNFRRLPPDAQAALEAVATLADRLPEETIARAAELPAERTAAALDELEWQRWLVVDARGYAFAARIVREVVARDFLTPGQRQRIIRRAAAIESSPT